MDGSWLGFGEGARVGMDGTLCWCWLLGRTGWVGVPCPGPGHGVGLRVPCLGPGHGGVPWSCPGYPHPRPPMDGQRK